MRRRMTFAGGTGPEDESKVRRRLWRKGYSIVRRHADGNAVRLHVAPPSGWSVLEAYLETKQWKEVHDSHFMQIVN